MANTLIHPIILAAGKGTRMNSDTPKALVCFNGEPMLKRIIRSITKALPNTVPTIVVGHKADRIQETIGPTVHYTIQTEQKGTGHAVACALKDIHPIPENIIILYADHPLLSQKTISALIEKHTQTKSVVTLGTITLPNFDDWHTCFERFGRIIRTNTGAILAIREWKDASLEEREITEVSPSYFCFQTKWLEQALQSVHNTNVAKEFYLTDVIAIAVQQGHHINHIDIAPHEGVGINTPTELALAEQLAPKTEL